MPSTDYQGPSPFASFGRTIFGIRREQVHSLESNHESSAKDIELESFQKQVTDRFQDLSGVGDDDFLSIDWIRKLLYASICCHEEFRAILLSNKEQVSKSRPDQSISEFFERSVKALDICNASRHGMEKIQMWLKHADIVLGVFMGSNQRALSEGQFWRARNH